MEGVGSRIKLRPHTAGSDTIADQPFAVGWRECPENRPARVTHAVHIGKEDEVLRFESGGACNCHLVGIDVIDVTLPVARHAGNHRKVFVGTEQTQQVRIGTHRLPHLTQVGIQLFGFYQARVNSGETDGESPSLDEASYQFVIYTAGEHLEHRVDDIGCSHAQAVHECTLHAPFFQKTGHLFPAAVDDNQFVIFQGR